MRGTMIVHDIPSEPLAARTDTERLQQRKQSRKRGRRYSLNDSPTISNNAPRLQIFEVLMALIFSLWFINESAAHNAFSLLAVFSSSKKRKLTHDDVVELEDTFNAMYSKLTHLFLPFVERVDIYDSAHKNLDIPFIVSVIDAAVSQHVSSSDVTEEVRERMQSIGYIRKILQQSSRRQSI